MKAFKLVKDNISDVRVFALVMKEGKGITMKEDEH